MEIESGISIETKTPFVRVEVTGEYKVFTKMCTECGQEFSTSTPRKFFRNPDDESTTLNINGGGNISGHESIRGEDVARHIENTVCPDTKRNAAKE